MIHIGGSERSSKCVGHGSGSLRRSSRCPASSPDSSSTSIARHAEAQDLELVLANYFSLFTIVSALLERHRAGGSGHLVRSGIPGPRASRWASPSGSRPSPAPCCCSVSSTTSLLRGAPERRSPSATPPGSRCWTRTRSRCCTSCCRSTSSLDLLLRSAPARPALVVARRVRRLPAGLDRLHDGPRRAAGREPRRQHRVVVPVPVPRPARRGGYGSAFTYIGAMLGRVRRDRRGRSSRSAATARGERRCAAAQRRREARLHV